MRENNIMMTNAQKADRLALIKAVHQKRMAKAAEFKKTQKAKSAKVRDYTDIVETPKRQKSKSIFDMDISRMDDNHNQWTDASKYADQYYGDTMRETTKFDNDWD